MDLKKQMYIKNIEKTISINNQKFEKERYKLNEENALLFYDAVENNQFTIIKSPRQTGCSTFAAAYAVLHYDKSILYFGVKQENGKHFLAKIDKIGNDDITYKNLFRREFLAGSIEARTVNESGLCGYTPDIVIIDQAAFIKNLDNFWISLLPMLSTGGKLIVISTPMEKKGWFYEMFTNESNYFHKLSLKPLFHEDSDVKKRYMNGDRDKMYTREILGEFINNVTLKPLKIPPVRVEKEIYNDVVDRLKELSIEQGLHVTMSEYIRDLIIKDLEKK